MIRKLIFRTFLAGAALIGICLLTVAIAAFLAFRKPAFYADLLDQSDADPAITATMEQKTRDFEEWAMMSATHAKRDASSSLPIPTAVAVSETHLIEVTESQLNALLTSHRLGAGDLRNPRVQVLDDQLQIGAEISVGDSRLIFSAGLKPLITPDGALQLEIISSHVGSLPFPLHTLLNVIAEHGELSDSKCELDLSGNTPVLTLNISNRGPRSPFVTAVHCTNGNMAIEFHAPERMEASSEQRLSDRSAATSQR